MSLPLLRKVLAASPTLDQIEAAAQMNTNLFTEVELDEGLENGVVDLIRSDHGDNYDRVWSMYEQVSLLSAEVESSGPAYYQTHPLQVYMAASAILSDTLQTIVRAEPAQGKSFVLFLIAEWAINRLVDDVQYERVVIYSPTSIVVKQLKKKSELFPGKHDMHITNEWKPGQWARDYPKALYLIDEGEQLIQ